MPRKGTFKHSEETKKRLSLAAKKQWANGNASKDGLFKKGQVPWNKGKHVPMSKETAKKISETKKIMHAEGILFTEEHKRNISKALTGRKLSKPVWNKGRHFPEYSGENSPNWKGGIKKDKDRRKSFECVLWREAVFTRDNWTCQSCKERGGNIHPHHILNYSSNVELRSAIDNGITLCKKCHKAFHKKYGNRNNTQEQIDAFLACQKEGGLLVANQNENLDK